MVLMNVEIGKWRESSTANLLESMSIVGCSNLTSFLGSTRLNRGLHRGWVAAWPARRKTLRRVSKCYGVWYGAKMIAYLGRNSSIKVGTVE